MIINKKFKQMNVLVLADALKAGGGITIYNQFIEYLKRNIDDNSYLICVNPILKTPEIKNVRYTDIGCLSKFDRFFKCEKKLIKRLKEMDFNPDLVVSLQNNGLRFLKNKRHVIYYHQPMPLYPGRWNPFTKRERSLFIYKYIYPHFIKRTWGPNTDFVVQIPYIKKGLHARFGINEERIHVCFPDVENINASEIVPHKFNDSSRHFLYVVAGGLSSYKNIRTLIFAAKLIKDNKGSLASPIIIHLTTSADYAKIYWEFAKKLGVEDIVKFDGKYPYDSLLKLYKGATGLLFPSSIETLGLPLLEAAAFGLPIVAADKDYAKEVLGDYEGVSFVEEKDYEKWASEIMRISNNCTKYQPLSQDRQSSWKHFFDIINQ